MITTRAPDNEPWRRSESEPSRVELGEIEWSRSPADGRPSTPGSLGNSGKAPKFGGAPVTVLRLPGSGARDDEGAGASGGGKLGIGGPGRLVDAKSIAKEQG